MLENPAIVGNRGIQRAPGARPEARGELAVTAKTQRLLPLGTTPALRPRRLFG